MRAKLTSRNLIIAGLVSLFLIQVVSIGLLAKANRDTNNQLKSEQSSKQLIYSDLDTSVQQLSPSVLADQTSRYTLPFSFLMGGCYKYMQAQQKTVNPRGKLSLRKKSLKN
jgi:hypothetical protein